MADVTVTTPAAREALDLHSERHHERTTSRRRTVLAFASMAAVLVLGIGLTAAVGYHQRLGVTNVDGISYMSIARDYANGWFGDAVNAYWSPMVSWLMAPLVAVGLGLPSAFLVVNLAAAAVVLGVGGWVVWSQVHRVVPALVYMVAAIPALMATVSVQTPDLLVVAWIVLWLWALRWADRVRTGSLRIRIVVGVVLGIAIAAGYFVKLFLVPVVIGSFVVWMLLRAWSAARRREPAFRWWPTAATAVVVAVVVAAPWVGALTHKYGYPTLGSSLDVNISSKFDAGSRSGDWPWLPVPPNPHAVTANEDFTKSVYMQGVAENPDPSASTAPTTSEPSADAAPTVTKESGLLARAQYYVQQRVFAFPFYLNRIASFAPFAVPIGLLFTAALVVGVVRFRRYAFACLTAATALVYFVGYALITSSSSGGGNPRYYWPLFYVSTLLAALMLPTVWRFVRRRGVLRIVVACIGIAVVPLASFSQNWLGHPAPFVASVASAEPLDVTGPTQVPELVRLADEITASGVLPPGSNVVGTNTRGLASLAFLTDTRMFGRSGQGYNYTSAAQRAVFREQGIRYFFQYDPAERAERDYSGAGTLVGTFTAVIPCTGDTSSDRTRPCRVEIIRLDG